MRCVPLIALFNLSISLKINSQNWNHQNSLLGILKILAFCPITVGLLSPKPVPVCVLLGLHEASLHDMLDDHALQIPHYL